MYIMVCCLFVNRKLSIRRLMDSMIIYISGSSILVVSTSMAVVIELSSIVVTVVVAMKETLQIAPSP